MKLGFTGVSNLVFLFFYPKHRLWVLIWVLTCTLNLCLYELKYSKLPNFSNENFQFYNLRKICILYNPYLTNGFSHFYHLGESTLIFRGIRSDFHFLNKCLMKILLANRIAPDGTPRSAASHLGLFCLPMSHKRDARLK